MITEIGGTVGDIESLPFLEAIRQFALDVGKENCLYIHLTLVPYLKAAKELKTKPTQHSVGQLRQIGIQPDILICRTEHSLSRDDREKIALFCNISIDAVIEEKDKDFSIYEVPLSLVDNNLDRLIVDKLGLKTAEPDLEDWRELLRRLRNPDREISIAVVGKYAEHHDAYKSIYESLDHAGIAHRAQVRIGRIRSEDIESEGPERLLTGYDGILVPGGFGERGIEGKVDSDPLRPHEGHSVFGHLPGHAVRGDRVRPQRLQSGRGPLDRVRQEHAAPGDLPAGRAERDHAKGRHDAAGRPADAARSRKASRPAATERREISERHRHRYEFNNVYRQQFAAHGMRFSGTSPDGALVEVIELPEHPWFVAVQYHPEFKSKPTAPQPLFAGFVGAAVQRNRSRGDRAAARNPPLRSRPPRRISRRDDSGRLKSQKTRAKRRIEPLMPDEKKIIIDEDWKSRVEAEKEASCESRSADGGGVSRGPSVALKRQISPTWQCRRLLSSCC